MRINAFINLVVVFLLSIVSLPVLAGPFGLEQGMNVEALKKKGPFKPTKDPNILIADSLPSGHPDVESYIAIVTPNQGLCKITAVTKDVQTSGSGSELRRALENIKSGLIAKYGAPSKEFDFLTHKSIWQEPQYWMMGLLKKERHFSSYWTSPEASLPDFITSIVVEAEALNGEKGYVRFGYEFKIFEKCSAEMKATANKNL